MEHLKEFWFIVVNVWKEGLGGINQGRLYIWLHLGSAMVTKYTDKKRQSQVTLPSEKGDWKMLIFQT